MAALLAFTGRLLLASLFLLSGAMKVSQHDHGYHSPIVQYMAPKVENFVQKVQLHTGVHVPLEQDIYPVLVLGAGCMELLGGVLFTLNLKLGALLLMLFLVPTSVIMHNFWDLDSGTPGHQIEFINFMKNLCLFGAFLMYVNMPRHVATTGPQGKLKRL